VTTRKFAEDNADLVKAVNAAYGQEAKWASDNSLEAETIAQQQGHYSDEVRTTLSSMKRQFNMHGVGDKAFVQDLQKAADWLAARSVLPQKINVSDYLAKV